MSQGHGSGEHRTAPFRLGACLVDPETRRVECDGIETMLEPLPMRVLSVLAAHRNEVLSAERITDWVWGPNHVGESPVAHAIARIRRALGDDPRHPTYIETIPKSGYRLIAPVDNVPSDTPAWRRRLGWTWPLAGTAFVTAAALAALWLSADRAPDATADSSFGAGPPVAVVLPFDNVTKEAADDLIAYGITDELRHVLAREARVSVIDPYSTREFLRSGGTVSEMPTVLGAHYTLVGTLRRDGDRRRIIARMIDNRRGLDIWTESFDYSIGSTLAMQMNVAAAAARAVRDHVGAPGQDGSAPPAAMSSDDPSRRDEEAYRAYVTGRYLHARGAHEDLLAAETELETAVTRDPQFALAWEALARNRMTLIARGHVSKSEGFARALAASDEAIRLAPESATAWAIGCKLRLVQALDWHGGEPFCGRAAELGPESPAYLEIATERAMIRGDLAEAIETAKRRTELDPLRPTAHAFLGLLLHFDGQQDAAERAVRHSLDLNPTNPMSYGLLGHIALARGDLDGARVFLDKETVPLYRRQGLAMLEHATGDREAADAALAGVEEEFADTGAYQIAEIYGTRGDRDRAIEWLSRAFAARDAGFNFVRVSPYLASVREDARFETVIAQFPH